jgi:hypothetical protein
MQNVSASSKLLGSSATGSGAPPSEITLGTNLSMSGSTLNAAGGGGGTPGGLTTQVQYNNAGAFGGDANFTYASGQIKTPGSYGGILFDSGGTDGLLNIGAAAHQIGVFLGSTTISSWVQSPAKFEVANNYLIGWSSTADGSQPLDTAFARNAAGVVEVNNGTAGTLRDLKTRTVDATNGYTISGAQLAGLPAGGTAKQVLSKNTATNYDASWATLSGATLQTGELNFPGTTSTGGVMLGLGAVITPVRSGKIFATIVGLTTNSVAGGVSGGYIRYGTGAAPANGGALVGTRWGSSFQAHSYSATAYIPFSLSVMITGLALGTQVWLDLTQFSAAGGGTTTLYSVSASAFELP